jgi:hypothetical protein
MKKYQFIIVLMLLIGSSRWLSAQNNNDYLGLPGDNLNLYAVMDLFRESETLEGFERSLNNPEAIINNLDLNGDQLVDYIMVFDYPDEDVHTIVLRVALNSKEYQDVAAFTVEKLRNGAVIVQLVGDEALYGPDYIVEPIYDETPNPGYVGNTTKVKSRKNKVTVVHTTYYEVASWPVVVYISRPGYVVWRSSWYWGYYPEYWNPWTPYYWHYYHGYHYGWRTHYHAYYRPWHHKRCNRYQTTYYNSIRHRSPTVVVNINKGTYKNTYSRPEKRKEGERVYAQRVSSGTTVPTRGFASRSAADNKTVRANTQGSERAQRPAVDHNRSKTVEKRGTVDRARPVNAEDRAARSDRSARTASVQGRQEKAVPQSSRNERNRNTSGSTMQRSRESERSAPASTVNRKPERSTNNSRSEVKRSSAPKVERSATAGRASGSNDQKVERKTTQRSEARSSSSVKKSSPARSNDKKNTTSSSETTSGKRGQNR